MLIILNMKIVKLSNTIQDFAWGDTDFLPQLLNYPNPEKKPQAELWMGVHPRGESLVGDTPLSQYLLDAFGTYNKSLGVKVAERFQGMPFLFKVLAAASPLSIQAHPNKEQAAEGFARENAAGITLDAPHRNYKDPNHKPEITLALTPFWALCGFRELHEIENNLLSHIERMPEEQRLKLDFSDHKAFFSQLMQLSPEDKTSLLSCVLEGIKNHSSNEAHWVLKLAQHYPGDIGALAPLYLNLILLQPGEAIYLRAGILHAYLEGAAMELMANSDNVLRGGLTPKHQDTEEMLKVLSFEASPCVPIKAQNMDLHRSYYPSNAEEFRLECWQLRPEDGLLYFPSRHPFMLAFVYTGKISINGEEFSQGDAIVIPYNENELSIKLLSAESATLYVAAAKEL